MTLTTLTRDEWTALQQTALKAEQAVRDYQLLILQNAARTPDTYLAERLLRAAEHIDGNFGPACSYFMTPQPEWTGGDSMDAKNFRLREPHVTGRINYI